MVIYKMKTRIAPTPSGFLHTGNAISFLLTYCLAKSGNGKLLLRIDDLDKKDIGKNMLRIFFMRSIGLVFIMTRDRLLLLISKIIGPNTKE